MGSNPPKIGDNTGALYNIIKIFDLLSPLLLHLGDNTGALYTNTKNFNLLSPPFFSSLRPHFSGFRDSTTDPKPVKSPLDSLIDDAGYRGYPPLALNA